MAQKKYASLSSLQTFLDNLKDTFASLSHKHTLSDITDCAIDMQLSPTSNNPVANKVIDAEFEAISQAMVVLEQAIDDKADSSHNHNETYYTKNEINNLELITINDIDTICGGTIQMATLSNEVKF